MRTSLGRSKRGPLSLREGPIVLLVVGHLGAPNLGDEAMLEGLTESVPATVQLIVSTDAAGQPPSRHLYIRRGLRSEIATLRKVNGVVLCGGTHLHDAYLGKRLLYHYGSLGRYMALFVIARLFGRKVHLLSIGAGPVRKPMTVLVVRAYLAIASTVSVRDDQAARVLSHANRRARFASGGDLALLLQRPSRSSGAGTPELVHYGLSVAPLSYRTVDEFTWDAVIEAFVTLATRRQFTLTVFVFSGDEPESDRDIATRVTAEVNDRVGRSVAQTCDMPGDVHATLAELTRCDVVLTCRYHSAVLSYVAQVRQVILPYHPKLRYFAEEVGLSEAIIDDPTASGIASRLDSLAEATDKPVFSNVSLADARRGSLANVMDVLDSYN